MESLSDHNTYELCPLPGYCWRFGASMLVLQAIFLPFFLFAPREKMKFGKSFHFYSWHVLGRLGWQDLSCCHWSLCTFFCPRDGNTTTVENDRPRHVLFCVGVLNRQSLHFSILLSSFSFLWNHLGIGLLCIWASGLIDLGFFPFKVFQHIDIMSHHALLQYSSLFPFI